MYSLPKNQMNPEYCLQLRYMIVFMTNMTLLVDKKWLTQIQDVKEAFCSRIKAGLSTCAQVLQCKPFLFKKE